MMTLPALNRLVEGNRDGMTTLHTRPNMVRFLQAVFSNVSVVSSPRKASPISSALRLRRDGQRFDSAVTLRNSARAKIFIRLMAPWCAGSLGEGARFFLTAPCRVDRSRHQVHDADAILGTLGLETPDPSWCPDLPLDLLGEGREALRTAGDGASVVGLAPSSARGETKRWPVRCFAQLADLLLARGFRPVVVIGPGEDMIAENLCRLLGRDLQIIGRKADVAALAATVTCLPLLVGNDSGPMQLAARLGTPVVAIFGPSSPSRTGPLGPGHHVITPSSPSCRSARRILVEEVASATLDVLGSAGSHPRGRLVM
jgi:heptosyltransferase-1